jgi:hypothetical protein
VKQRRGIILFGLKFSIFSRQLAIHFSRFFKRLKYYGDFQGGISAQYRPG